MPHEKVAQIFRKTPGNQLQSWVTARLGAPGWGNRPRPPRVGFEKHEPRSDSTVIITLFDAAREENVVLYLSSECPRSKMLPWTAHIILDN